MDIKEFIIAGLVDAHRMGDIAMEELTPKVAHFEAGGTANSIAQLLAHMTMGEDHAVNGILKGGTRIFDTGGWSAKTGIPDGRGAVWQKDWQLNIDGFTAYRDAVKRSSISYFETPAASDLDREVEAFGAPRKASNVVQIFVINHLLGHSGEISALKGIQGLKGLPF